MSVTPLVLLSELKAQLAQAGSSLSATFDSRVRTIIEEESDRLQKECHRRFDERIETRYFDAISKMRGGPVYGLELEMDDDLRAVTSMTNGDGTAISTSDIILTPRNETPKTAIRLDRSKSVFWQIGTEPVGAISVTGTWGYKGEWAAVSTINNGGPVADSDTTFIVDDGTAFEVGMTLRIDTEYLRVTDIASDTLTVERGVNGSTAATHTDTTAIDRWGAEPLVQNLVKRLAAWRLEQDKSPLFGQVTLGDVSFPVDISSMPNDVQRAIRRADLIRYTGWSV